MKPLLRNLSLAIIAALVSLQLISCKKSSDADQGKEYGNLLVSKTEYNKIMAARENQTGQTFTIENISRTNDQLKIMVKGGCSAEDFRMVWNGTVMESYPMQVKLVLQLNTDHTQVCSTKTHSILIDLTKIIGTHAAEDYVFHIANGSIKQDKSIYPDGAVSK